MNANNKIVGEQIKIFTTNDILEILKTFSNNTYMYTIPKSILEFANSNILIAKKSVEYIPNIYFYLNSHFKNNKKIMKATILSFKNHQLLDINQNKISK